MFRGAQLWWRGQLHSLFLDFSDLDLAGASVNLSDCNEADISSAVFRRTNLQNAVLSGCFVFADLSGAVLTGARMSGQFIRANLVGADLRGAVDGRQNWLDFSGANLTNANLAGADFTRTTMSRFLGPGITQAVTVTGANLEGTRICTTVQRDLVGYVGQPIIMPVPCR